MSCNISEDSVTLQLYNNALNKDNLAAESNYKFTRNSSINTLEIESKSGNFDDHENAPFPILNKIKSNILKTCFSDTKMLIQPEINLNQFKKLLKIHVIFFLPVKLKLNPLSQTNSSYS